MRVAEAVHVDGFHAHARAAVSSVAGADAVAGVFFAVAPFVEGEVLAAHGGVCCECGFFFVGGV